MDLRRVFLDLYQATTERQLEAALRKHKLIRKQGAWQPIDDDEQMAAVIASRQVSPIGAIVEKLTNSMDALLLRRCAKSKIATEGEGVSSVMENILTTAYPARDKWHQPAARMAEALNLQVIVDGYQKGRRGGPSVVVYDAGEGQEPEEFINTFLSFEGGRHNVPFSYGSLGIGGTAAFPFCGNKGYQLFLSKRNVAGASNNAGFTVVRRRVDDEASRFKYEYLTIDGAIPAFEMDNGIDLGLHEKEFTGGTICKMFSYDFPVQLKKNFPTLLNQRINEMLYAPAFPVLTVYKADEASGTEEVVDVVYGLKSTCESTYSKIVEESFDYDLGESRFGRLKVQALVFKHHTDDMDHVETAKFMRDNVLTTSARCLFTRHGEVIGFYDREFMTRGVRIAPLKDSALIVVNCDEMKPTIVDELFLPAKEDLVEGARNAQLWRYLSTELKRTSLVVISQKRREAQAALTAEARAEREAARLAKEQEFEEAKRRAEEAEKKVHALGDVDSEELEALLAQQEAEEELADELTDEELLEAFEDYEDDCCSNGFPHTVVVQHEGNDCKCKNNWVMLLLLLLFLLLTFGFFYLLFDRDNNSTADANTGNEEGQILHLPFSDNIENARVVREDDGVYVFAEVTPGSTPEDLFGEEVQ